MKRINGITAPTSFAEATGSWILFTAGIVCGLCLRGKQRALKPNADNREALKQIAIDARFIDVESVIPMWSKGAKSQRWNAYKRHIKTVHNGNWNLNQGFGKPPA